MSIPLPDPALVEQLAIANRILYDQGIVDGLGHVSVRHDSVPGNSTGPMAMAWRCSLALVSA